MDNGGAGVYPLTALWVHLLEDPGPVTGHLVALVEQLCPPIYKPTLVGAAPRREGTFRWVQAVKN